MARERLLDTAVGIFYADGIHAVGVDRIIGAAGVTRATFYRHFPGKEDLVVAYLEREDASIRSTFVAAADAAARAGSGPDQLLDLVIEGLAQDVAQRHTRGCPFINAAAEYPDPTSAVRGRIRTHRDWFRSQLVDLLTADGTPIRRSPPDNWSSSATRPSSAATSTAGTRSPTPSRRRPGW